jgi:hypothetical protein
VYLSGFFAQAYFKIFERSSHLPDFSAMVLVGVGDQRRLVKEGSLRLINSLSEEMLDKKTLPEVRVTNKRCQSIQDPRLGTDIAVPTEGLPKLPGVVGERQGTPRKAISASFGSYSVPASGAPKRVGKLP